MKAQTFVEAQEELRAATSELLKVHYLIPDSQNSYQKDSSKENYAKAEKRVKAALKEYSFWFSKLLKK